MTQTIERQIINIIATDRIDIPISSMSGKLKRAKPKLASELDLSAYGGKFEGDRVYARVETEDATMKARTMREAVDQFAEKYPRHGKILNGFIEETRVTKESNLYFGINSGSRLTAEDYLGVMTSLGFSEGMARNLYPELMDASRKISKARAEERSILVG